MGAHSFPAAVFLPLMRIIAHFPQSWKFPYRGSYTSPALAAASYPFVDLPPGNTLRCKLFQFSKFYRNHLSFSCLEIYNEVSDKKSQMLFFDKMKLESIPSLCEVRPR